MPTLRNWSAAVLATATEVPSFAATPMTSDSCWPSLLIRPRVTSGGPVLAGVGAGGGRGRVVARVGGRTNQALVQRGGVGPPRTHGRQQIDVEQPQDRL